VRAIKAAAITGCIVFVFEAAKQYAYPETSIWTSHTISRPSLQKYEHAKTAASEGPHLREIMDNNPGVCLRDHGFAQLVSGFSRYHSAFATNDG
jgi:hypothetical protein